DYGREGLIAFLRDMRIYQTSAVKCMLAGEPSALGEQVIANCRKRFLDKQIELLADIELILPMGRMAIASVFHVPLTSVDLRSLIGRPGAGILERDPHYRKMIVGLPHPSGNNRQFNPPLIHEGERLADVKFKASFVRALNGIRVKLEKMGYPLRKIPRGRVEGPLDRY
ncbi:MAG TPA: uracil-DNA glycosylase family protein, partial [Candidatus Bathyarchaeia archaeon]